MCSSEVTLQPGPKEQKSLAEHCRNHLKRLRSDSSGGRLEHRRTLARSRTEWRTLHKQEKIFFKNNNKTHRSRKGMKVEADVK